MDVFSQLFSASSPWADLWAIVDVAKTVEVLGIPARLLISFGIVPVLAVLALWSSWSPSRTRRLQAVLVSERLVLVLGISLCGPQFLISVLLWSALRRDDLPRVVTLAAVLLVWCQGALWWELWQGMVAPSVPWWQLPLSKMISLLF